MNKEFTDTALGRVCVNVLNDFGCHIQTGDGSYGEYDQVQKSNRIKLAFSVAALILIIILFNRKKH